MGENLLARVLFLSVERFDYFSLYCHARPARIYLEVEWAEYIVGVNRDAFRNRNPVK